MKFIIHVQDEKAPFFLELIQNLSFAKIEKMEPEESEDLQRLVGKFGDKKKSPPQIENNEVTILQDEIDDFFGK